MLTCRRSGWRGLYWNVLLHAGACCALLQCLLPYRCTSISRNAADLTIVGLQTLHAEALAQCAKYAHGGTAEVVNLPVAVREAALMEAADVFAALIPKDEVRSRPSPRGMAALHASQL